MCVDTMFLPIEDVRAKAVLRKQYLELLKPYYLHPQIPLKYALDHESTHVYLTYKNEHLLAAFFARLPECLRWGRPTGGSVDGNRKKSETLGRD